MSHTRLVIPLPSQYPSTLHPTEPFDFMRDLLAYLIVLAIIVAVAYDGKVGIEPAQLIHNHGIGTLLGNHR